MGLSGSAQSSTSRRVILLSIYLVIALAFPLAYKLTSVQRLPIDSAAIRQWSHELEETGCVVRTRARVGLQGLMRQEWREDVAKWLTLASETSEGKDTQLAWCVDWDVAPSGKDGDFEFEYTLEGGTGSKALNVSLPSTPVSVHSASLAIARRIALDLRLPFRSRLGQQAPLTTKTSVQGQDLRDPAPEPDVGQGQEQDQIVTTTFANDEAPEIALPDLELPDDDDVIQRLLSHKGDSQETSSSDISISLPSHLHLHLHVLNEDYDLSSALAPINASFTHSLRSQLSPLQDQIRSVTQFGVTTTWGIGKTTQDVQWEQLQWTEEDKWSEEVEMMEMRDVEYEEEEAVQGDKDETVPSQSDDERRTSTTRKRKIIRREPFKVRRNLTHVDWIPRSIHHLPSDQLEIFVDESGWDLTDRGTTTREEVANFPYLFGDGDDTKAAQQIKSLHFVLYNPALQHRPLLYLGENGELATAKSLYNKIKNPPKHWGWIVPTWGGIIIYNGGDSTELIPLIQDQLRLLLDIDLNSHSTWHLFRRTIRTRTIEAVETLQATLNSIEKLTNLEIGHGVQMNVEASLDALSKLNLINTIDTTAFQLSLDALSHASKAFHHPRMLGMLYFPAEHIYAVYTPLFGPLAVPLILVGVKELKRIRKGKKKSKDGKEKDKVE